jgi:medium-chain acyl-[acyl-carrier-protein] hydrolase
MATAMKTKSPWLVHHARHERPTLRLICFPYAGAGAAAFRNWAQSLPDEIDVLAIQPPGREGRFTEPFATDLRRMAASVVEALVPWLDVPFATFGHSLGTLLSFETVLELRRRSLRLPSHMVLSGRGAPHTRCGRSDYHLLSRERFIEELRKMEGTPEEVLESEELMSLLLPMLRADFALNSTYTVGSEPPLPCPMTVYGGTTDVDARGAVLDEWQRYTTSAFAVHMFEGGHFFVNSARAQVLQSLKRDLDVSVREDSLLDGVR